MSKHVKKDVVVDFDFFHEGKVVASASVVVDRDCSVQGFEFEPHKSQIAFDSLRVCPAFDSYYGWWEVDISNQWKLPDDFRPDGYDKKIVQAALNALYDFCRN